MSTLFNSSDALIGRSFGPYTITEKHAEGGMAIVYKAFQPSLNRWVAIKVLRGELAQDRQFIERFQREAMAVAKLSHPNILHVYDAGVAHGVYYLVMDYAEGGSLKDLIAKGPLDMGQVVSIGSQIAEALDHAHRQGLVHRDVKPSNVLLTREGRPLLSDFGIAKILGRASQLTRTGASIGTPEYMAPEQAQGLPIDGRTDIYALGLVLYEALTGWAPFGGQTPVATLYRQVNEPPPPLHQVNINVPAWLEGVVNRALAKRPEERFQHASQLAEALRLYGMPESEGRAMPTVAAPPGVPVSVTPKPAAERLPRPGPQPKPAPPPLPKDKVPTAKGPAVGRAAAVQHRPRSRRPIVIAVLVVLLLALLAVGAWYFLAGPGATQVIVVTPEGTAPTLERTVVVVTPGPAVPQPGRTVIVVTPGP